MATEAWIPVAPDRVYRYNVATGAALSPAYYTVQNAGEIVPVGAGNIWAPDGQRIVKINGDGTVASILSPGREVGGGPIRRMSVVNGEVWKYDDGVVFRYSTAGAYLGKYDVVRGGSNVVEVTVS